MERDEGLIVLLVILALIALVLSVFLYVRSGDNGSPGATGATGPTGLTGPIGLSGTNVTNNVLYIMYSGITGNPQELIITSANSFSPNLSVIGNEIVIFNPTTSTQAFNFSLSGTCTSTGSVSLVLQANNQSLVFSIQRTDTNIIIAPFLFQTVLEAGPGTTVYSMNILGATATIIQATAILFQMT